jgi:CDP-diacylglycerol--glycerol-3-phosphate 3-phosphatidyltransferase
MGVFEHWPNRITALRFLGALGLFAIFATQGNESVSEVTRNRGILQLAFWTFIVVAASDVLDGYLARRGNHITAFGRIADPFVDKVLVMGAMVYLAVMPWSARWFPAWIVVVILAREFLVTAIRGYVESMGVKFPADWLGKVKMFTQCFSVGVVVGMHAFTFSAETYAFWGNVALVFVYATLVTSVASCVSYLVKTRQLLLEGSA